MIPVSLKEYGDGQRLETTKLDSAVKNAVLKYMSSFPITAVAAGSFEDAVTGREVDGSYTAYNDGVFRWTTCDIYHLKKYNLALNPDFISKATSE